MNLKIAKFLPNMFYAVYLNISDGYFQPHHYSVRLLQVDHLVVGT